MSYLCSPRRPNESSEDYNQRWKNFQDARRRDLIDEYYRQKESGRLSPDSDGVTFEEFGAEVRFHERQIRIEEGRPRPEDLPKPREWPRIEFPPDFEPKSLSEISGYIPVRGEEPWESFFNQGELTAQQKEMAAAAEEAESTRMHTSIGSRTTAPSAPSPRSGHKRKRDQDDDVHSDETTLAASKKKKKSRMADPISPDMGQITPSISSRRGRSHHQQEQQRKRGREEGEDVLDEERHAARTLAAKKRRTDTGALPPATSRWKKRQELTEDAEDGGHAATTSKRRRTNERNTVGPSRGRRAEQGAPRVPSPIAPTVGGRSPRRTEAAAAAAITIASLSSPSILSSTRITRARRRQLAGKIANLFQLGHRGEICLQEEAGCQEALEAAAANATTAANKSRQQPTNTMAKANNTANTTISRKAIANSKIRARAKPKAGNTSV